MWKSLQNKKQKTKNKKQNTKNKKQKKQNKIKSIVYVSLWRDRNMNDVISAECNRAFFQVGMASFMFLSQHRDTKATFRLFL